MTYCFNDNEFTTWHLLEYFKRAYGNKINNLPFDTRDVHNWLRLGKLPDAYGGNKVTSTSIPDLDDLLVITVERLNRKDVEDVYGELSKYFKTLNKRRAVDVKKKSAQPKKQRTALYYQILGSKNSAPLSASKALPNDWKATGIKANQLKRKKREK